MKEVTPSKGLEDQSENAPTTSELIEAVVESNAIIAVALMRVYDVLMCLYGDSDPSDAQALAKEHKEGKIRSEIPWLTGQ